MDAPPVIRPAAAADIPAVAALVVPDPACPLTLRDFHRRLASGEYRPEWIWLSGDGDTASHEGIAAAAIWWGDAAPDGLDALFTRDGLPREQRAALAGRLIAAAHAAFTRPSGGQPSGRTIPAFHLSLPPDWRARQDVVTALSWRWQAALAAGLTEELERLGFAWHPGAGVPAPSTRLEFRYDADDEMFTDLFRRTLTGTLDATTRRAADAVGTDAQARADVAFYRDRMHGERDWWLVASLPGGEPVGFGIPSRNTEVPVVGYIGVLPEHRGHGYIDDILAETTRVLADEAGGHVIHADTDVANRPMAAAFERAGYVNFTRRLVLSGPL
ncbi:MAG TPA: GNAT family N-acetyltransferase [Trebonia sp.]|jgi:RimJ/RimL family protein N-acetyltransferase|nr:GNAT family N-acetyltransferase [Trebonia sp.]